MRSVAGAGLLFSGGAGTPLIDFHDKVGMFLLLRIYLVIEALGDFSPVVTMSEVVTIGLVVMVLDSNSAEQGLQTWVCSTVWAIV